MVVLAQGARDNASSATIVHDNAFPAATTHDNAFPAATAHDNAATADDNASPAATARDNGSSIAMATTGTAPHDADNDSALGIGSDSSSTTTIFAQAINLRWGMINKEDCKKIMEDAGFVNIAIKYFKCSRRFPTGNKFYSTA